MNPEQNPWTTLSTQNVYQNAWISVDEHQVLRPDGKPGVYGVVTFQNYAMGVVALDEELNTWLVGQYRYPLGEYSWEIPEGGGPKGDDLLASIQRELKEETGYEAREWTPLFRIHTSNSVCNEVGYVYLAEGLTAGESEPEPTEVLALKKVPLAEAVDMVMRGEITDSISMAALLYVARLKGI